MVDDPPLPRPRGLVVIGGSAGSLPPLLDLVQWLPAGLDAAVLVVLHIGDRGRSRLSEILQRAAAFPVRPAADGERLVAGRGLVAVPGRHLVVVGGGRVRLDAGPRVNRSRPAVDPLFTSAARWWHARVVAVVLSGALDDGAVGAATVAAAGGRVIVQDPARAAFTGMPGAARRAVPDAVTSSVADLAGCVVAGVAAIDSSSADDDDVTRRPDSWRLR